MPRDMRRNHSVSLPLALVPKQARCRATVPQVRSELITLCSDCCSSSILVWTRVHVYRRTPTVLSHVAPEHPDHGPGEPYTLSQSSFCRNPCWSPGGTEEEPRWRKVSLHPNRLDLAPEQNPSRKIYQQDPNVVDINPSGGLVLSSLPKHDCRTFRPPP